MTKDKHIPYTAEKTKRKYNEQISLGLWWCVYLKYIDRSIVAWCTDQHTAEQIAYCLNKQVGVDT